MGVVICAKEELDGAAPYINHCACSNLIIYKVTEDKFGRKE
jgi:hypothetical protein